MDNLKEYFIGVTIGLLWPIRFGPAGNNNAHGPAIRSWLFYLGPLSLSLTYYRPETEEERQQQIDALMSGL